MCTCPLDPTGPRTGIARLRLIEVLSSDPHSGYCPSRPRPGSTPEYLYFTPFAANRFSDANRERLLGRTGGVHLCKAGDPQVVDPARSIGDYRLKGELPTGYVSS